MQRRDRLRRVLLSEALEPRSLMAADVGVNGLGYSSYWNSHLPADVNADARVNVDDVLYLVHDYQQHGFRSLSGAAVGGEGEGPANGGASATNGSSVVYVDPNNDSKFNIDDILVVIHELGGEGEDPLVFLRLTGTKVGDPHTNGEDTAHPGTPGSTVPTLAEIRNENGIAVIDKGSMFELRSFVQDRLVGTNGIAEAMADLDFDLSKIEPVLNEQQTITLLTDTSFTGGTFQVTFVKPDGAQSSGNVTLVAPSGNFNATATTNNLRATLVSLIGSGNFSVTYVTQDANANPPDPLYRFSVRFQGLYEGLNMPAMQVSVANLTGGTNANGVVTQRDGNFDPQSSYPFAANTMLSQAILPSPATVDNGKGQQVVFYEARIRSAGYVPTEPNRLQEMAVFGTISPDPYPHGIEREYWYMKMVAIDGSMQANRTETPVMFQLSEGEEFDIVTQQLRPKPIKRYKINDNIGLDVPTSQVNYGGAYQVIVREYVTAIADDVNTSNATPNGAAFSLTQLMTNDFSFSGTEPFQISGVVTPGSRGGTVAVAPGNASVIYTPPVGFTVAAANASGPGVVTETFTYEIAATDPVKAANPAYRDTATVTVKLIAPNIAPTNNGLPATATLTEGQALTLTGVSITDSDNQGVNVTVTLTTTIPGTLVLNGVSQGAAGTSFPLTDSVANINGKLGGSGIVFTPSNVNFNGSYTLTMTTSDNGSGLGSAQTDQDIVTVNVNAVNDAPTFTAVPTGSIQISEDEVLAFTGPNAIVISDVDINEGTGNRLVTVTLQATHQTSSTGRGTFALTTFAGLNMTANTPGLMVFQATLTDANNALATLTYTPNGSFLGAYDMQVTANDNGNNPAPAQSVSQPFNLTVIAGLRPKAFDDTYTDANVYKEEATFRLAPNVLTKGPRADAPHTGQTLTLATISNIVITRDAKIGGGTITPPLNLVTRTGNEIDINLTDPSLLNFFGTIQFDYTITDDVSADPGADAEGRVIVNVANVNDAPVRTAAVPTTQNGTEDVALVMNLSSFFTDADNDPLTVSLVTEAPASPAGSLTNNAIATATYQPPANYNNPAKTLTFAANDGQVNSTTNLDVTATFAPVADKPLTPSFTAANITEDPTPNNPLISLASQVSDPDGGTINFANLNTPTVTQGQGTVTIDAANSGIRFTPAANYFGPVKITYSIKDGDQPANVALNSDPGVISFNVTPVNDAPVANDDGPFSIGEGQNSLYDVLANDGDVDASSDFTFKAGLLEAGSTFQIVGITPNLGTAVFENRQIRYTAPATIGVATNIEVHYTITDPSNAVSTPFGRLKLTLQPKNDPPVIGNTSVSGTVNEDGSVDLDLYTLASVTDPDSARSLAKIVVTTQPAPGTGTVTDLGNGVARFAPAPNFNGAVSFKFKINDGDPISPDNLLSAQEATVSITVTELNDPPVANDDNQPGQIGLIIANGDDNGVVNTIDVLANDNFGVDAINQNIDSPLKIVAVGTAANPTSGRSAQGGTLTITPDGKINYKAPAGAKDYNDEFVYTVRDRNGNITTGLEDTAVAKFFVQQAVPVSIVIDVFRDKVLNADDKGNGLREAGEAGYANVEVFIQGTDFNTNRVDLLNPATGQRYRTDINGRVTIPQLLPGNYDVWTAQPALILDGKETSSEVNPNDTSANPYVRQVDDIMGTLDGFHLNIPIVPKNAADTTIDLLFAELGENPQFRAPDELLVSSGPNGMKIAVNGQGSTGTTRWASLLTGWANVKDVKATLTGDNAIVTITHTNGTQYELSLSRATGTPSSRRFRLVTDDKTGNYIIRLDGAATVYSTNLKNLSTGVVGFTGFNV